MSIYIKGMEMPKHCWQFKFHDDMDECIIIGENCVEVWGDYKRLENCPLVPVPEHGRLIDADALNEAMARMVPWAITDPTVNAFLDGLSAAYEVIQSAPTIIPAEEGADTDFWGEEYAEAKGLAEEGE